MTVMQRSGNKKVTLVENLDFYGITEDEFAHTAQKVAAASTTGNFYSYLHCLIKIHCNPCPSLQQNTISIFVISSIIVFKVHYCSCLSPEVLLVSARMQHGNSIKCHLYLQLNLLLTLPRLEFLFKEMLQNYVLRSYKVRCNKSWS